MPAPATLLLVATLLPLASFTLLVFVGKRMGALAGIVGTLAIAASFACSAAATFSWLNGGTYDGRKWGCEQGPINLPYKSSSFGRGMNSYVGSNVPYPGGSAYDYSDKRREANRRTLRRGKRLSRKGENERESGRVRERERERDS